jgi:hypothetical protein
VKLRIDAPNTLTWTVRRLIVRFWMRRRADSLVSFVLFLPLLPFVLLLRRRKVVPWTLEAVTRPWGRGDGGPEPAGAERIA